MHFFSLKVHDCMCGKKEGYLYPLHTPKNVYQQQLNFRWLPDFFLDVFQKYLDIFLKSAFNKEIVGINK